jgi:hypothetical protein
MRPMKFGFGQPVRRVEDHRLTTGAGRYTDDTAVEGALHAFVLRSQYAHATFKIRDKDAARKMKGVKLILTGEDVAHLGDIPCKGLIKTTSGENVVPLPVPVLPTDIVRHVGEAVAFIVAETLDQARDAAEAIDIEWTTLPSITGIAEALEPGAPQVWPNRPGNVAFEAEQGDKAKTEAAFAKAARTVSVTIVNNRLAANYMETRACIAEFDKAEQALDADARQPGQPWHARHPRDLHPEGRSRPHPRGDARCRRRLRHKDLHVSRIPADHGRGREARAPGALGFRPDRAFPGRHPWPRQSLDRDDGARRQGQVHRPQGRSGGRDGRLSLAIWALHSLGRHHDDAGLLQHSRPCMSASAAC